MTLIEGVGDEVIHFFLLLAIALVSLIAWWSTNLSERPLIRTVVIVEQRTIHQAPTDTQTIAGDMSEPGDTVQEVHEVMEESETSQSNAVANSHVNVIESDAVAKVESVHPESDVAPCCETRENINVDQVESIPSVDHVEDRVSSEDHSESILRNRRLAFFEVKKEEKDNEQIEYVENVNATDEHSNSPAGCETDSSDSGHIRIRLKYLNDDQKLVEGKLQEQLGDFKRRHFSLELAGRKLVRLIFKGQVLQEDTKTLENCGFFDNCVVHCLVQSRTPPPSPSLNRSRNESHPHNDNSQHWNLGNILIASLSLLLGLAWYCRYQYAQLYTATTTVALLGLTGIFTVSLIGMYMPDTDGVRTY